MISKHDDPRPWYVRWTLTLVSPLLEKNPIKVLSADAPIVFSLSHFILLAFAVAMLRQVWTAGIAGWPDATVCVAILVAKPLIEALEQVSPQDVVEFGKVLLGRFGVGGTRTIGSVYDAREPSVTDDHTVD